MNLSFVSNNCVGWRLFEKFNVKPYNNPFIATLIPDDYQFIKLINNLTYYANVLPAIDKPKINRLHHPEIKTEYPVIFLEDIEIHCIHEIDNNSCLNKFKRRIERFQRFLKDDNNKIYIVLTYSQLISSRKFPKLLIMDFLKPVSDNIVKIFLGPSKYYIEENKHYININEWDNIEPTKDKNNLFIFDDADKTVEIVFNCINNITNLP
jgi:uncharacterized protein (DUF1919 family)